MIDQKLRDDMMCLRGQLSAIKFPLTWSCGDSSHGAQAYYDLIDSIAASYDEILDQLFEDC